MSHMKKIISTLVLILALGGIVVWPLAWLTQGSRESLPGRAQAAGEQKESATAPEPVAMVVKAPEITGIEEWINSEPLKLKDLRGQVVVLHFWTFG
jgi:hypothetical protein